MLNAQNSGKGRHDVSATNCLAAHALSPGGCLPYQTLPHFHTQHHVLCHSMHTQ